MSALPPIVNIRQCRGMSEKCHKRTLSTSRKSVVVEGSNQEKSGFAHRNEPGLSQPDRSDYSSHEVISCESSPTSARLPALVQHSIELFLEHDAAETRFSERGLVQPKGENAMRSLISILALAVAVAFTAPAFAGPGSTITNKEDLSSVIGQPIFELCLD